MQILTARKNTKYSRNETILKIVHHEKDDSLCIILTLGQTLKFQKKSINPFYKSFRVVLCKKPLEKNTRYSRHQTIFKMGHNAKNCSLCKIFTLGQRSKFQKLVKIHSTNHLQLFWKMYPSKFYGYLRRLASRPTVQFPDNLSVL